jgi:hypothetical protein
MIISSELDMEEIMGEIAMVVSNVLLLFYETPPLLAKEGRRLFFASSDSSRVGPASPEISLGSQSPSK